MLQPKAKRIFKQIIPIGLIWFVMSMAFLWTEYAITRGQKNTPDSAITIGLEILLFASFSVFIIGLLVGLLELTVTHKWFKNYSFIRKIIGKQFFYLLLMESLIFLLFPIAAAIELDVSFFSSQVIDKYVLFFFSITHVSTIIQIGFSLLVSLLYLEVRGHLGQDVFRNFFTGKYHRPKEELRIFLFSDMKSSTTIAEQVGHVRYFKLLQEYYNELSDAIINTHGEVYQYIGDEIVITWNMNDFNHSNHAIQCFLDMKKSLLAKKSYFEKTYGYFPDFKAAIHLGEVTTGEIGALKKEIFFTGDVLNTTSRMQGLCKKYQTDLIISKSLFDHIDITHSSASFEVIEGNNLEGKQKDIILYRIETSD